MKIFATAFDGFNLVWQASLEREEQGTVIDAVGLGRIRLVLGKLAAIRLVFEYHEHWTEIVLAEDTVVTNYHLETWTNDKDRTRISDCTAFRQEWGLIEGEPLSWSLPPRIGLRGTVRRQGESFLFEEMIQGQCVRRWQRNGTA